MGTAPTKTKHERFVPLVSAKWIPENQSRNFFFATTTTPAIDLSQLHIQRVPEAPSPGVKWSEREADHSHQPSVEVKNSWSYTIPLIHLHGMVCN